MNLIKIVPTVWMLFDGKTDNIYFLRELRRFIGVKTAKVIFQVINIAGFLQSQTMTSSAVNKSKFKIQQKDQKIKVKLKYGLR